MLDFLDVILLLKLTHHSRNNYKMNFIQKDSTKQVKSEGFSLGVDCCLCLGYFTIFLLEVVFGAILMHSSTVREVDSSHACFALYSLF